MFVVGVCACFHGNPKESHIIMVKRIFRYLNGTRDLGLWYPNNSDFMLVGYSNFDFVGYTVDRQTTTWNCQVLDPLSIPVSKRNNTLWLYHQPKLNTYPQFHVVLKS